MAISLCTSARTKKVDPEKIDRVCGGVMSGESPHDALTRAAKEETGIEPLNVRVVVTGLNKYNRFRYLLIGEATHTLAKIDLVEAKKVRFIHPTVLSKMFCAREETFVDEFFEDTELAIRWKNEHLLDL